MKPAFKAFSFRTDRTPRMAVRLFSQNVRSREIRRRPGLGDVVEWRVNWPNGVITLTSAANGGLTLDARTGAIAYPITVDDVSALDVGEPVSFVVSILNGSGARWPFLEGTISREAVRS